MGDIEKRYQKLKDQKEHILLRPDMYIGSIESELKEMYIVENLEDMKNIKFSKKIVNYNPAFIKLFDELLTNASDHYIRTNEKVKKIKINVTKDNITIENDGPGIPIKIHKDYNIYVPELIFGHLLSGENYNDNDERKVGGRNGLGAKLTNIYSKKFDIECCDGINKYYQTFYNNLSRKSTPKIIKAKIQSTKITFYPDFHRFKLTGITEEIQQIFLKRAVDIAVYCPKVKVYFNDKLIPVKNIKDYMKMYIGENELITEKIDDDWEIGVTRSEDEQFQQISMVNGIFTYDGGTHVAYISNRIVKAVATQLKKKYKGTNINENAIKRNLFVFVNSKIVNPIFSTQTKEKLITNISNYKEINISNLFVKKILESEIIDTIITYIESREAAKLKNASSGKKYKVKVKKLNDANKAGTTDSKNCLLFLTEGDCLYEETEIKVIRDDKIQDLKIKDLKLNDAVITHKNNIGYVKNISKKIKKSVKIKLKNDKILICSKEHKWFVYDIDDKQFKFIKTMDLNKTHHKMIFNKNVNIELMINIITIDEIKDNKYDFNIHTEEGDILSTRKHKFSVFNTEKNCFNMVCCENLNKNIHILVSYSTLESK